MSGEYVPSLGVVQVVLVQCSSVSINQYKKRLRYNILLHPLNLILIWYMFDQTIRHILKPTTLSLMKLSFTGQNGRPLEIGDKANLILLINKQK